MFETIVEGLDRAVLELAIKNGFQDFLFYETEENINKIIEYVKLVNESKNTEEDDSAFIDITTKYLNESINKYGEMLTEGMKQGGPKDPANTKTEGISGSDATATLSPEIRADILDSAGLKEPKKATKKITEGIDSDFLVRSLIGVFENFDSTLVDRLSQVSICGIAAGKVISEAVFSNEGIRSNAGVLERAGKFYTGYRSNADTAEQVMNEKGKLVKKIIDLKKVAVENEQLKKKIAETTKSTTPEVKPTEAVQKAIKSTAEEVKPTEAVQKAIKSDISGTEAAGTAIQKGLKSAGETVGDVGKKLANVAGDHPVAAAAAAGLGVAGLLNRRKKYQQ